MRAFRPYNQMEKFRETIEDNDLSDSDYQMDKFTCWSFTKKRFDKAFRNTKLNNLFF